MKAGTLDRKITLQSVTTTIDEAGTPSETWTNVATVRAHLVTTSTDEILADYGEQASLNVTFEIRWLSNVSTANRVQYDGKHLNIRAVREIGRRRGLELVCEEIR